MRSAKAAQENLPLAPIPPNRSAFHHSRPHSVVPSRGSHGQAGDAPKRPRSGPVRTNRVVLADSRVGSNLWACTRLRATVWRVGGFCCPHVPSPSVQQDHAVAQDVAYTHPTKPPRMPSGKSPAGRTASALSSVNQDCCAHRPPHFPRARPPPVPAAGARHARRRSGSARARARGPDIRAAPTVTSFTPTSGPLGCVVVITGTGFSDSPAADTFVNFLDSSSCRRHG